MFTIHIGKKNGCKSDKRKYLQFELPLRIRINRIVPLKCKESKIKGLILVLVLFCFIPFRPYALPRDDAEVYNVSLVSYFSY